MRELSQDWIPRESVGRLWSMNSFVVLFCKSSMEVAWRKLSGLAGRTATAGVLLGLFFVRFDSRGAAAGRFVQDRFAIGFWVPPQTEENLRERYREIADANFTLVIGSFGKGLSNQLALCKEFHLHALVDAPGAPETFPEDEACWGYQLMDEPSVGAFPDLATRAEAIRTVRPGRFGFVNLFPNYATAAQLGTASYDEYVAKFIREVKPEVLSMDHYPLMRPNSDTRDAYCANLETLRSQSLGAGIPFWNFFYSMPFNDRLDPTEAQIRWQINASLAYGAKGVLYFCYWTPGKGNAGTGEFPKGGAIMTAEGLRTRHYGEARRINAELRTLGPTLMKLTSTGARRVRTDKDPAATLVGTPIRNLTHIPGDPAGEFIVGTFRHDDGRRFVLLVNHSYAYTAWPTVEFDADMKDVREVHKATGKAAPVIDDSPELKGLQISLGAGDARLFFLPQGK